VDEILKERNIKQFVLNYNSPKSPSKEWSWFLFMKFLIFALFAVKTMLSSLLMGYKFVLWNQNEVFVLLVSI
jgi:nitrate reductase NapE component